MKCILAVAFAVVLVVAEGKVLPASDVETQQTANQTPLLSDYLREAQNSISNLTTMLNTQIQEKFNQDELFNTLKEQTNALATNVQQYIHNMSEEVKNKNPELENIWTNFKSKVNEMVDKISVNQETSDQISQLGTKFQEGVQSLVRESENTMKSVNDNAGKLQEDIAKFTRNAIDLAVQATQNLNNQLQQGATHAQS